MVPPFEKKGRGPSLLLASAPDGFLPRRRIVAGANCATSRKTRCSRDAEVDDLAPDRVAFVLSGGAGLGAVQVGMLRALYERDIVPQLIVGTSVGAVNGAFVASRPQTVETARELGEIWRNLHRGQIFPLNPLSGLLGFLGSRDHLVPASGLRQLIVKYSRHQRLEQMPIEFHVVAVDVVTGEELLLSHGPVLDAVSPVLRSRRSCRPSPGGIAP